MLTLRYLNEHDTDLVRALHSAQGLDYELPDIDAPEFILRAGIENSAGLDTVLLLRQTAETYLIAAQSQGIGAARELIGRIRILDRELPPIARKMGLTDVYANIPPELEARFAKMLFRLGWKKNLWPQWTKKL